MSFIILFYFEATMSSLDSQLFEAVKSRNIDLTKDLLDRGADIKARNDYVNHPFIL